MRLKYGNIRTWSNLAERWFSSKAECRRGEELHLLQLAGEIRDLRFQIRFLLNKTPKITITIDFDYWEEGEKGWERTLEDTKGVLTRDFRTKLAWLKEKVGIDVKLTK